MKKFEEAGLSERTTQESAQSVILEQSLTDRWRVVMKKCEHSGLYYVAGFATSQ
ncbi:hypothetical protein ACP9OK_10750 [Pseudomonas sp. B11]